MPAPVIMSEAASNNEAAKSAPLDMPLIVTPRDSVSAGSSGAGDAGAGRAMSANRQSRQRAIFAGQSGTRARAYT
jgi:hypothetical protein